MAQHMILAFDELQGLGVIMEGRKDEIKPWNQFI